MKFHFDAFISYASDDRDCIVGRLATLLEKAGLRVWYDNEQIEIGDDFRQKIDLAISRSRYCIVILSRAYLRKKWPLRELSTFMDRESKRRKVILPVCHNVTEEQVRKKMPTLAGVRLLKHENNIDEIAAELIEALRPKKRATSRRRKLPKTVRTVAVANPAVSISHERATQPLGYPITCVAFHPKYDGILCGDSGGFLRSLWETTFRERFAHKMRAPLIPIGEIRSISLSRDGTRFVVSVAGCRARFGKWPGFETARSTDYLEWAAMHPAGKAFLGVRLHDRSRIHVYNASNGERTSRVFVHGARVNSFCVSSATLASAGSDAAVKVWSTDGVVLANFLDGEDEMLCVAMSRTGHFLASGGKDGLIRIWDMKERKLSFKLPGHCAAVTALAFSPDDRYLASGSADASVRLWSVDSKSMCANERHHQGAITSLAFNRQGTTVVSASRDRTIALWSVKSP